jgi:hypothetical protein
VLVQGGNGELEIAASSDGQNVVIGANSGYSFSNNGGASFSAGGGTPGAFPRDGDPSLGVGLSGNFYYDFIGFPNGTPAANNFSGCSNSVAVSTNNGATFSFREHAVRCPQSGPSICLPDQEHLAVDRINASSTGGDQLYNAWRNFTPASPATTCGGIGSGYVTASIVCSTNGGTSWTSPTAIGTGDWPRVTTGSDGFVYVAYRTSGNIMLNKYSSCSAGLVQQVGFPVMVTSIADVPCPVAGLDRCNDGNNLSSQMVAVDDTSPSHLYVAYANSTGAGNENVMVRDSIDGGATSSNNDLTNYYVGSVSVRGGTLQAGGELNLSTNADPQCASGFPCGARATGDFSTCPTVPAGATTGSGCPKYGDYNGNAAAGGRVFSAWASATTPPGAPAGTGIRIFSAAN